MSILVLDIGTTSMRGILYEKDGRKLAVSRKKNHLIFLGDSLIEEDPDEFTGNAADIICDLLADGEADVEAVAVTSQRSSIIPVDRNGKPLLSAIMWQDTRNREICDELSAYNHELFQMTGAEVSTVFSGSKMTWVRRYQKEIYEKVYKFLNIPEYVCFFMTGEFVSDLTYGSRTGLMNLRTGKWDPDILKLYEVEERHLCRLIEPGQTAGYVTENFAALTGLKKGIPVIHCGGDQQCAAVGHGILSAGDLSITVGTGAFIAADVDELPDPLPSGMIFNCSSVRGKYTAETNVLSCGAALDWCARELYGMDHTDYGILEAELNKENFVSSCLVVPYFSGRGAPDWDHDARAVFSGITTATRRSEIFKSIMESIFMEIAGQIERISETVPVKDIRIGGGMTASGVLNQLQADIYGRPVHVTKDPEATAFGCLITALCGMGRYASAKEAYDDLAVKDEEIFEPDLQKTEQYREKRKEMNHLYETIRKGRKS